MRMEKGETQERVKNFFQQYQKLKRKLAGGEKSGFELEIFSPAFSVDVLDTICGLSAQIVPLIVAHSSSFVFHALTNFRLRF